MKRRLLSCISFLIAAQSVSVLGQSPVVQFEGTYAGECQLVGPGISANSEVSFPAGLQYEATSIQYLDAACQNAVIESTAVFSYVATPADFSLGLGVYDIDSVLEGFFLKPVNPLIVQQLNQTNFCGFSDWAFDIAKNVSGLTCQGQVMPLHGQMTYDIIKIENGMLYTGALSEALDGSSPDKRPNVLSEAALIEVLTP